MISERQYARDVTAQDVCDLIVQRQRESNELEYKVVADSDLLKAACGIANMGGGFILIGIDEDNDHCAFAVVDVANSGSVADSVRQRLRDGLSPRPVIEVVTLEVDGSTIIVVRISPQNPPHMISQDKRTDFYGRYDATSERMRYEEIEQRFRDKHESGQISIPETPRAIVETISGRRPISEGAKGAFDAFIGRLRESGEPTLALIAVSDGNFGSMGQDGADAALSSPVYSRRGGWLVAHPSFEVTRYGGLWAQAFGSVSTTTINPSGDTIFLKAVDEVLCWRQTEAAFNESPRLYPNALVEYCLSFAYLLADVATRTQPRQILAAPILSHMNGCHLPLGEGGSVWFDAPIQTPSRLESAFAEGTAVALDLEGARPLFARHLAFDLAAQIYSFFGYRANEVAFASDGEILQESDPNVATLTSIRSYLQNVLRLPLSAPVVDFDRDVHWFNTGYFNKPYRIGVSEEFVEDHNWTEAKLYAALDNFKAPALVNEFGPDRFLVITNEGPKGVARR